MKRSILPLATLALFCSGGLASAVTVATDPVGFANLSLTADADSNISIPFIRPPDFAGGVQSVTANTVTLTGSPGLTPNKYVYAAGSQPNHYYALIGGGGASNPKEGHTYLITGNTANTITVDTSVEPLTGVTQNTQVTVVPYWTLSTVFPAGDMNVSFTPTTSTTQMKTQIMIPNDSGTGIDLPPMATYYFSNNADGTTSNVGWRVVGDNVTDHGDDLLLPDSYLKVRNQNGSPTRPLTTLGAVLTKKLSVPLRIQASIQQDNPVSVLRPIDITLNMTGLNAADGSFGANDQLLLFKNGLVGFNNPPSVYYRDPAQNFNWRLTGDANLLDHGNDLIPLGTGFIVRKAATGSPGTVFWTNSFPVQALSAVSRKVHGGNTFDLNLPVSGTPAVESRAPVGGGYQIVVTFPQNVSFTNAAVTSGTGTVDSSSGSGSNQATVNLGVASTAVPQFVTVTLSNVDDGSNKNDVAVTMGVLVGDASGDGTVNSGDYAATRSRAGQATDGTNFRFDYNCDGNVNSGDATIVRGRSGSTLFPN